MYHSIFHIGKVTDPRQNIVCKCEKVTEAEIITALHRSLPIDSTQAMRKRTRAGRYSYFVINICGIIEQ